MKGQTIRRIREIHQYIGVFFAPAILFFAVSGAFQTLGMHEDRGHAKPMAWVEWMASVHKDQLLPPARTAGKAAPRPSPGKSAGPPPHRYQPFSALKAFVLCLALALVSSTLLGITIAYTNPKRRRVTSALLTGGTLLPIALLFLQR